MAIDFSFRRTQVRRLTTSIGVYALCDLDNVPIYVGQSKDGIRARVQRHLTSARSDIIANRQVDVWEIAFVWAFPVSSKQQLGPLEATLYSIHHPQSRLMNGTVPKEEVKTSLKIEPEEVVQVMPEAERLEKLELDQRLPRQAKQYADIVGHFLAVKNSDQISLSMDAHFERLSRYHAIMLNLGEKE